MKKKLIFLLPSLSGGGAERVSSHLIPYFQKNFQLTVVLIHKNISYSIPKDIDLICLSKRLNSTLSHILNIPLHNTKFIQLARKLKPDVILSFMEQANIINLISSYFLNNTKIIISQRTNPIKQYENKILLGVFIKYISKILYKRAYKIISVSNGIRDILIKNYGINRERIITIYNPVIIDHNDKSNIPEYLNNLNYIINVGRLSKAKAHDILLKAFYLINKEFPNLHLVIVGDGGERENIIKLSKELKINEKVILTGWLDNPHTLKANAKLFILSSHYEGLPNVLLEAIANGCPVISTDCETGPREILGDNEFGILVPTNNPEKLANAAISLLKDEDRLNHLKNISLIRAKDFDIEIISKKYIEVLSG